ncbi:MAG TPA: hypothetical protein VHY08_19775 [Bacillota bacterium]|nr:hypothetical protein [Bacillota bacterium]
MKEDRCELEIKIEQVWKEDNWSPMVIHHPKFLEIAPFIRSIKFKLDQAVYHLENVLNYESKVQDVLVTQNYHTNLMTTKYELDSLIYALNSVKDILAKLICTVYDINKKNIDEIYFSTLVNKKTDEYRKLKIKKPTLFSHLVSFNKTEERKFVQNYCNSIKHQDALLTHTVLNQDNKADVLTMIPDPKNPKQELVRVFAPKVEEKHREAICAAGQIIIPDLGYKRRIDSDVT